MTHPWHRWPTADEIATAHAPDKELDRNWSCFDTADCRHGNRWSVLFGSWAVSVCESCGDAEVRCTHVDMKWNDEGTLLRCTTCGIDGT